jgi:ubiquinone/menaquinone biosynthesis C-methylase UbiE
MPRWKLFRRRRSQDDDSSNLNALPNMLGGRRRTKGVPYQMPIDDEEMNRLDFQHYALRFAFRGLYAAPIEQPVSILDVGTGTGRWAIEMANVFPRAHVVGLDINVPPIDERAGSRIDIRPPNYEFVAGNVLEGLPFADSTFDFVHARLLVSAIPAERWFYVIAELKRVTRRGGWIESVETISPQNNGPAFDKIASWTSQFLASRGVDFSYGAHVSEMMRVNGLTRVRSHMVPIPLGEWGGRLGRLMASDYITGAKGIGGAVTARNLASVDEFNLAYEQAVADFGTTRYHGIAPFYVAFGQK